MIEEKRRVFGNGNKLFCSGMKLELEWNRMFDCEQVKMGRGGNL